MVAGRPNHRVFFLRARARREREVNAHYSGALEAPPNAKIAQLGTGFFFFPEDEIRAINKTALVAGSRDTGRWLLCFSTRDARGAVSA